ncbi:MAG: ATP-binding cassette domain-containing protein [Alphaproteobacteria bacterium]|nr:ATP-binding cassette domain-containing protein [Alphaproteobacteria bacterium]
MHDSTTFRDVADGVGIPTEDLDRPLLPLVAENLAYSVDDRALVDIRSLTLRDGGPTVILGPNGAGKSLLLRLLHGLIEPTKGEVLFGGRPADETIRRRQAMVFQRPVLLRRSVAANVDYALKAHGVARSERRERILDLLAMGGLTDKARQPARTLSGGEQQRLALVRALATEPDVLFLDEPTASLYPGAIKAFEALVRDADRAGTKVVMVTQDIGQARRLADEVIFMYRGKIVEKSAAATFFDAPASDAARQFVAGDLLI